MNKNPFIKVSLLCDKFIKNKKSMKCYLFSKQKQNSGTTGDATYVRSAQDVAQPQRGGGCYCTSARRDRVPAYLNLFVFFGVKLLYFLTVL